MGLLDAFGLGETGVGKYVTANRGTLGELASGLAQGTNFSDGIGKVDFGRGHRIDDANAQRITEEDERKGQIAQAAEQKNKTTAWLRKKAPQHFEAVQAGAMTLGEAYSDALKQQRGGSAGDKPSIVNAGGGQLYNATTGEWLSAPTPEGGPAPDVTGESALRKELQGLKSTKEFNSQAQAYQRVLDSSVDESPAGDLALIFNYMKVLDPGSVVRESEFATAAASGSFDDRINAAVGQILSGTRLAPEQRRDFLDRAGKLYQGSAGLQKSTNDQYRGLATSYGFDNTRVVQGVPQIGVLNPKFNIDEFLNPDGTQAKPLPVTNDADYEAIPSGVVYTAPDGSMRTKR